MIEIVSAIVDAVKTGLCFCCARAGYFDKLEIDLQSLEHNKVRLEAKKSYIETVVNYDLGLPMRRKQAYSVGEWLLRVSRFQEHVDEIIYEAQEELKNKALRCLCPKKCCSYDRVGQRVSYELEQAKQLIQDGYFDEMFEKGHRDPVGKRPTDKIVGLELISREIWEFIENPDVKIIGLYGVGGVGKTTLLKSINNMFCIESHNFDLVIWIEVSMEGNASKVQEAIRRKLNIPDVLWDHEDTAGRTSIILEFLQRRNIVLLLDDLREPWKKSDLIDIGVLDNNQNRSKVIFTTRSEVVCGWMMTDRKIKVECLSSNEALELFWLYAGQDSKRAHPRIPKLARGVVTLCSGLPLALITVGQAMSTSTDPQDWEDVIDKLKGHHASNLFSDIEDRVFPILKVSFDSLGEVLKICFLFLSIFLEVHNVNKRELIELWIAEGFLDPFDDIYDARRKGEKVISSLKKACLLESGGVESFVRMHDMLHDMTLWLACEEGKKYNKVLVQEKALDFAEWSEAEMISLWGHRIEDIRTTLLCPNVHTLIIRDTKLKTFPEEVLRSMTVVRVLDLSNNHDLAQLPKDFSVLINLSYLNLSGSGVQALPAGLTNVKILLLDYTADLSVISTKVILGVSSLQVFSKLADEQKYDDEVLLEVLEENENLRDISVSLFSSRTIQTLMSTPKLHSFMRQLSIINCKEDIAVLMGDLIRMKHLERLSIRDCPYLDLAADRFNFRNIQFMSNLRHVCIWHCDNIIDLSWLALAPNLQILEVFHCKQLAEVICCGQHSNDEILEIEDPFLELTDLVLGSLPALNSICNNILPFPLLNKLHVNDCPSLEMLPFGSESANKLKEIRGSRIWWNCLIWENEYAKNIFSAKFIG